MSRKTLLLSVLLVLSGLMSRAQTLFSYGSHAVSKQEFLKAYNKNYSDTAADKLSYREYLDLYIKFRLKVQAAMDARMDTTLQQRNELASFRNQLAESFLKEDASMKVMVDEAANRSLKDIYLSHIFFPARPGSTSDEIAAAENKIKKVYARLQNGESYDKLAAASGGEKLGYVTVFVLPYAIENIVYSTPVGKYSVPYQSSSGYHIFSNAGERKAVGKVRVAQIMLSFPPEDTTAEAKKILRTRADSIYNALKAGADFSTLAAELSNDNLSYQTGGQIPVFGVGEYDTAFEKQAFALENDSDISKPFFTSFGIHILKRLQRIPVNPDSTDREWRETLKDRVSRSDRMKVAEGMLLRNIRETIKKDATAKVLASDTATLNYYRNHLEKYNPEFAGQLKEFREGNLLFSIMQQKVWDAASTDTTAIQQYYVAHKNKYFWENSADALIITATDGKAAVKAREFVKDDLDSWRRWAAQSNNRIQVDSGRFELSQIPVAERTHFQEGLITAPVSNQQDSSVTLAYIIKLISKKEPRTFEEARGAVINDYQNFLEETWIAELKKLYPVKINTDVLQSL